MSYMFIPYLVVFGMVLMWWGSGDIENMVGKVGLSLVHWIHWSLDLGPSSKVGLIRHHFLRALGTYFGSHQYEHLLWTWTLVASVVFFSFPSYMAFMSINTLLSKFSYWEVREHSFVTYVLTPLSLAPSSLGNIWTLRAFQNMNWMASLFYQKISNLVKILNFF